MAKRKLPLAGVRGKTLEAPEPKSPLDRLTFKQELFCEEYVRNGGNATAAYLKVYDCTQDSANGNAIRLMVREGILAYIEILRDQDRRLAGVTRLDVLRLLAVQAFFDPTDAARAVNQPLKPQSYKRLGNKRLALSLNLGPKGAELTMPSAADRRAAANDLWDKLGLGQESGGGNWFDGLGELADLVRSVKGRKP